MSEESLEYLTKLYVWSKPVLFDESDVEKIIVKWFSYYNSWRVTVVKHYKNGDAPEIFSKDPVFKYIIDKCFTNTEWGSNYREIEVLPPCGHEGIHATLELMSILELNEEEELYYEYDR